ncbi:MAG: PrgI family protein [Gracilibacteraceae bacterium]|jgi:hypothetical protein|nr:PrgI family protein [Gracilibacteraceae bacterium]
MAYVPVPKDLTKVKTKVALNLTKRQLICFGIAAAVGIPAYLLTRGSVGGSAAVLLMIVLMLPFFFFAMFEQDGQSAEKILRSIIRARLWPGRRPYRTENLYKYLSEGGKPVAIQAKRAATTAGGKRPSGSRARRNGE